jgi:hypothetical protein
MPKLLTTRVILAVQNLRPPCAEFVDRRVPIGQPPSTKPWGMREFTIRTPDGHRMTFGAAIPTGNNER